MATKTAVDKSPKKGYNTLSKVRRYAHLNWIDRFCQKHRRFGIPNLMMVVVVVSALVFLLSLFPAGLQIVSGLTFDRTMILKGQIWRLITFAFIPETFNPIFIIFSLYFYYLIGSSLEREWGTAKFTLYYLMGIVLTALVSFIFDLGSTATYLNFSLFFAFATFYPDFQVLVFFILPVKIKWLAVLDALYFVVAILTSGWPYFLIPIVAVGNYFLFFWRDYVSFFKRRRSFSKSSSAWRRNMREIKSQKEQRPYTHKCAVCGITDLDDPDMEFRYCSLCTGYKCYCSNHLFSHEHK